MGREGSGEKMAG
jgi:hypothetical protein